MENYDSHEDLNHLRVNLFMNNPKLLSDLDDIPQDIQVEVVLRNPFLIKFMENPCEAAQEKVMVGQNVSMVGLIQNPTERIIEKAIELNAFSAILNIRNPTENVKRKVLEKDPYLLEMVKNPSDELQLFSLEKIWTKNWYENVILEQFTRDDAQWFQREFNKLKLCKGPLKENNNVST